MVYYRSILFVTSKIEMSTLTPNAINIMLVQINGNLEKFNVQATISKVMGDCMMLNISDGLNKAKAIITLSNESMNLKNVGKPYGDPCNKYLIQITSFSTFVEEEEKALIQINNFVPLQAPRSRSDLSTVSIKKEVKFQDVTSKKDPQSNRPIQAIKSENKTPRREERRDQMEAQENEATLDANELKKFDKIADLFVDIPAWQIVVRVIDKNYREFNNKAAKLIKLFSMTLIDRTGMKIEGVMFGDTAKDYYDLIKLNGVYRMTRGQIREENYNQNRGDKYSRYNITFTKNSIFIPIKDVSLIPRAMDSNVELKQLLGDWNFERQFDIAGILLSIGEERVFQKDGRSIYKKTIVIGDPQIMKSIEVVIWNKEMFIDPRWVNKTLQLKFFKLNNYKDTISLNSIFKSDIRPISNHRFSSFEAKYSETDYDNVTYGVKESNDAGNTTKDKYAKNIRDLEHQINHMNSNQVIYSDLQVWLTHASFKGKWFYEACNNAKCKRSTEAFVKCIHCGHYNDNTHKKFILPIEISDMTGSLWTTAFDEFASQIFKGIPGDSLYQLSDADLKEEAEMRLYHQYKIRLSTKKEIEGNIKHSIMGKPGEVNIEKSAINNVERITKMLYQ